MDFQNSILKPYFLAIVLLACTLVYHPTDAKTLTVGGPLGWTNFDSATSASPDYSTWVSGQSVNVGDVLVFNYAVNFHDVYLLPTKAAFDSCTFASGKSVAPPSAGTYSWTAPSVGLFYFSCSFGGEGSSHCQAGQKLAVNVVGPAQISPALAPATPTPPIPSPTVQVPVASPIFVPVTSPVPIIVPIPTPTLAPTVPVSPNATAPAPGVPFPLNITAPAPAPAGRVNVSAPVPAPSRNATNVSTPAPAPVIVVPVPAPVVVLVPTPVPTAPVIPVPVPSPTVVRAPVPAPRHAPRPAPHHAPRPAPRHAPHPSPRHSPRHAPAPTPYLGPPAPPLTPTESPPDTYTPEIAPSTENDASHAGVTSPLEWRSLVLVISLMTAFLVL